jgi:exosortase
MPDDRSPAARETARWQGAAAAGVLGASVVFVYGHILRDLVRDWASDGNYSHAFLVVPFAAYAAWCQRDELARTPLRPHLFGLVIVAVSLALLSAGTLGVELFLARLSLIGLLAGAIVFVCGPSHLRMLGFPLMLLVLTIPPPAIIMNQVALPLQSLTSRGAAALLGLLSVPVLREGNVLRLPRTALEVEEACSGLRSIVSLFTVGVLAGYLSGQRPGGRMALALITIPIAVLANALRVASLGVGAHYYGIDVNHSVLHDVAGYSVFVTTLVLLFCVQGLFASVRRVARPELPSC